MIELKIEKTTLGAGCFWGVEEEFRKLNGVISTRVGYLGGSKINPTYEEVCSGKSGHAEVVEISFDSNKITFEQILKLFWKIHNPTQLNRQGVDIGSQYRSAIFYHSEKQKQVAIENKLEIENSKIFSKQIVTEVSPTTNFYLAEEYHQKYLAKRGLESCHV
ncbi:MAG: peptide-methionine (S)-S-oxide reductase MsrA [Bacteroidetes bacterium]|nr:peptide-methionine (S)-S-oxide reductase MsrA [Bacteroidota bacterium]